MKGTNLRIQELREDLVRVINESQLPVAVTSMVLVDILGNIKAAENKMLVLEKQAYEKELAEKEGAKDVEVIH